MYKPITNILVLSMIIACNNATEETNEVSTIRPVKYFKVGANKLEGKHTFTGLAKAQQEADLSFKVSGTVDKVIVKVGDRVKKGDILAVIDATDYQVNYNQSLANVQSSKAQIESAQAQLESARANFINAESNYQRFEKLYETNSISLSDFEQAKSAYQSAEASLKAAHTQVNAAKASTTSTESMAKSASNQISYTRMKAPFSGVVVAVNVEPNEIINQGTPAIVLNSESNPDIEVGVPENVISEIKAKQKVHISFNSIHDKTYDGFVHEIGYSPSGNTYPVTIRLTNGDNDIRPGMPANALFEFNDHHSKDNAMIVPASAVGEDKQGNFVYLIETSDKKSFCKKKHIKVGKLNDIGFEVLSGISTGDLVASAGLNILRDGMQVSLYQQN